MLYNDLVLYNNDKMCKFGTFVLESVFDRDCIVNDCDLHIQGKDLLNGKALGHMKMMLQRSKMRKNLLFSTPENSIMVCSKTIWFKRVNENFWHRVYCHWKPYNNV